MDKLKKQSTASIADAAVVLKEFVSLDTLKKFLSKSSHKTFCNMRKRENVEKYHNVQLSLERGLFTLRID